MTGVSGWFSESQATALNGIMEALRKRKDDIRFIQVRHEEAAAFMAMRVCQYTGKLGVCLATTGRADRIARYIMKGGKFDYVPSGLMRNPSREDGWSSAYGVV